ncbi:MAG TPA: thioesterase family protein [Candidatus Binatia bacterium]|nr:thioesterase family protein [Candidatus Binatia bacterium]
MPVPSQPAFFVRAGDRFVATESTRGPWGRDYQHGGPPAALLTRALEELAGTDVLLTRLTFDFLRPAPIAPLTVRAEVVRAGSRVRRLQAVLSTADGTPLVQAAAVAMRTAAVLPATLGNDDSGPLPVERATPFQFGFFPDPIGYHTAMEIRVASGSWGKGPMAAWMRPRVALVEGETVSPLQRLMIAADSASGVAVVVEPAHYTFVNADLTVAIHRPPEGEWVCLDAATVAETHGIGLTRARLWDVRGALGISLQSCLAERRTT